ncbi:MAG: hypothetical protein LBQ50_06465 [Planctomycetaceae bacterium]|jgi:hypothetical protein|nr:hypothetical protein [Planctomycetaceae bacterium]
MKNNKEVTIERQSVRNDFNTIFLLILLVIISLFLGLLPNLSFGQDGFLTAPSVTAPSMTVPAMTVPPPSDITSSFLPNNPASTELPPVANPMSNGAPATSNPPTLSDSFSPPSPLSSPRSPVTPKQTNVPMSSHVREPNRLLRSVVDPNHPFARYFDLPKDPQSMIKGQPYTIAQLLDSTKTPGSRRQLLQTYWELTGLLAVYNIHCEAERMSRSVRDAQQNLAVLLLQQQRRAAEIGFVKKQCELTELLRRFKGISLTEKELPIPCDYPLFKRYETFADKIARTERSQYLGRLIPIQEQLIDAKHRSCTTTFEMLQNIPPDSRQLIEVLNQRTTAFLELVEAVVDYNKMIAEYTSATIPPDVSGSRLVGALIELPKTNATPAASIVPAAPTMAAPAMTAPAVTNNSSTEYTVSEMLNVNGLSGLNGLNSEPEETPQQISQTIPQVTSQITPPIIPQRLPVGRKPFAPIGQQPVVPASYVEEQ